MTHPVLTAAESALELPLATRGDLTLLDSRRRMLLLSRTEKFPQPDAPWLLKIHAAIAQLTQAGEVLVTGTGRLAYEAAAYACQSSGGSTLVVCASPEDCGACVPPATTLLVFPQSKPSPKAWPPLCDRLSAALSSHATAIHVRKGGNMAALIESLRQRNVPIDEPAQIEPGDAQPREAPRPASPGALVSESEFTVRPYLLHFTRDPDGPWPGEARDDYLQWLCGGATAPQRDAFATLRRILDERRLRGCGRLIAGGAQMVCFTARQPSDVAAITRWRRGLLRWNFTPYALAIPRTLLETAGAKPVRYVSPAERDAAPPADQKYLQLERSGDHAWTEEQEWRISGAFDFRAVPPRALLACVAGEHEAAQIFETYGIRSFVQHRTSK